MDRKIILFISIIILNFLTTCKVEDQINYPTLQTGDVTDITSSGAVFYAKIMSLGNNQIIDYGFVWSTESEPTIEKSYVKSLGNNIENKIYSAEISSTFIQGKIYYVRAFIKDEFSTTYGRQVLFTSLGSKAPKINDIYPKIATWGDTITIVGENFSFKPEENKVQIDKYSIVPFKSSDNELKIVVPQELAISPAIISASFLGNIAVAVYKLSLTPPVINEFGPQSGTYKTIVEIKGKYFHPKLTSVKFDTISAKIANASYQSLLVEVPSGLAFGEILLSVKTPGGTHVSNQKFFYQAPIIISFSPESGTFGNQISIIGNNFSSIIGNNLVKFGDFQATIIEASTNILKVLVPNNLNVKNSKISIVVNEQKAFSNTTFSLLNPLINSFTPGTATFGDLITITGQNFNPIPENNIVKFGDSIAIVTNSNATQLNVKVPNNYYSTNGKTKIKIAIGELSAISATDFELQLHSITSFAPNYGSRGDIITIYGDNFNPDIKYNKVYIGNAVAIVQNATSTSLKVTPTFGVVHGNQSISIEVAGRKVTSSTEFMVYEPWKRLADFTKTGKTCWSGFSIGSKGYVLGSHNIGEYFNDVWEYDPSQNIWTEKNNFPENLNDPRPFSTSAYSYIMNYSYYMNKSTMWRYDNINDTWTKVTTYPGLMGDAPIFVIGNKIYFGPEPDYPFNVWEYDETTNLWTKMTSFNNWAHNVMGFSVNGHGYILYGFILINNEYVWDYIWEYSPASDTWIKKFNTSDVGITGRRYGNIIITMNEKAYFIGGSDNYKTYNDVYVFDPVINSCKKIVDIPITNRTNLVGFSMNNKIYVGMGFVNTSTLNTVSDFWEFDPSKQKP